MRRSARRPCRRQSLTTRLNCLPAWPAVVLAAGASTAPWVRRDAVPRQAGVRAGARRPPSPGNGPAERARAGIPLLARAVEAGVVRGAKMTMMNLGTRRSARRAVRATSGTRLWATFGRVSWKSRLRHCRHRAVSSGCATRSDATVIRAHRGVEMEAILMMVRQRTGRLVLVGGVAAAVAGTMAAARPSARCWTRSATQAVPVGATLRSRRWTFTRCRRTPSC